MPSRFLVAGDNTLRSIPDTIYVRHELRSTSVDNVFFISDGNYEVISVAVVQSGLGAGSSTLDVMKCDGTDAPASGTTILAAVFALDSTANTPVVKNAASGLTATIADRKLASGDRLSVDLSGTISSLVGNLTVGLKRLQTAGGSL
jgi:hypothetical protein